MSRTIHDFHLDPDPQAGTHRKLEILSLSRDLRLEAQARGVGINSSYLAVHDVLAEAFAADPSLMTSANLHAAMSTRLQAHLATLPTVSA